LTEVVVVESSSSSAVLAGWEMRPVGLQLKFNLILAACFLFGLLLSSIIFYQLSRREALDQLQAQIDVLRSQALSIRRYTSEEIQPLLADQSTVQFLPQTVPSFSAQTVFRNFRERYPQFFYKEAALNPTNPSDQAKDWELEILENLRRNPTIERDVRIRNTENGTFYTATYPLVIRNADCLTCHSTPEKAPPSLVALYGPKNGFGWKMNETVAAQIISVPMSDADAKIWKSFIVFISITSGIFLGLLVLLDFMLYKLVIFPVRKMATTAEIVSMGDESAPEYQYPASDEVGSLSKSFNRMRRSLDSAMKMLESS
jgi:protein-histidine pros-kinase